MDKDGTKALASAPKYVYRNRRMNDACIFEIKFVVLTQNKQSRESVSQLLIHLIHKPKSERRSVYNREIGNFDLTVTLPTADCWWHNGTCEQTKFILDVSTSAAHEDS